MFLLLLKVSIGDGIVLCLKPLVVCSEGQNFRITFIALAAEGVNLVTKANLFFLLVMVFGLSVRCLLLNCTLLVYRLMKWVEYPLLRRLSLCLDLKV